MRRYITAAGCILFLAGSSYAGELDRKIKKLIQPFVESAQAGEGDITVAVFPFQTDEKLAKKRINFAVSELLTQELYQTGKFKLVERNQLDAVLKEQKLSLSDAMDSETAARLGKLLGARQIILGSVSKLGRSYQINARLVDSDTGEIIVPSIVEVPVAVFDEEADRYLTLVPERQTIGLQIVVINLPYSTTAGPGQLLTATFGGNAPAPFTATPEKGPDGYTGVGLGVRYFPTSWLAVEGTYFFPNEEYVIMNTPHGVTPGPAQMVELEYSRNAMRFGVEYTRKMSEKFRLYGGMQVLMLRITDAEDAEGKLDFELGGYYLMMDEKINLIVPALRLGAEWRPQSRIGLSLFGNLALGTKEKTVKVIIQEYGGTAPPMEMDLFTVKYPALSFEAAFTFYF